MARNPIGRNIGQVFGVFGHVNLTASGDRVGDLFDSTVRLNNLYALEQWIADLKPPPWPADILGEIDENLAARGKEVYTKNNRCSACHPLPPYPLTPKEEKKFGKQFVQIRMIPVAMIGTDPRMMRSVVNRQAKTGNLASLLGGRETVSAVEVMLAITGQVLKRLAKEQQLSEEQPVAFSGFRFPRQPPPNVQAYKARPLDGIWATAPYLHNGSVPNLYQLMLPPDDRDQSFYLGARQFDPKHVGFVDHETPGAYLFDTDSIQKRKATGISGMIEPVISARRIAGLWSNF